MVLGSGIRDPGSGENLFRIPDPGVKKAPDPGSGSATLSLVTVNQENVHFYLFSWIFHGAFRIAKSYTTIFILPQLSLTLDLKSKVGNIRDEYRSLSIKKWSRYSYVALMIHCLEKKGGNLDVLSPDSHLTKIYTVHIKYLKYN
jgi:hypothetical protein